MTPEAMAADAAGALAAGTNMTLVRRKGQKMPPKFPRGEPLCENFDGSRCYSYSPLKVLAWIHSGTKGGRIMERTPAQEPTR